MYRFVTIRVLGDRATTSASGSDNFSVEIINESDIDTVKLNLKNGHGNWFKLAQELRISSF